MTTAYADNLEHLLDELTRVDAMARRAAHLGEPSEGDPQLQGLVISDADVRRTLGNGPILGGRWKRAAAPAVRQIDADLTARRRAIDARWRCTPAGRPALHLPALAGRFGLSACEVDLLLVALATELEGRYEQVFAYLQNDVTRRRPSVDLALTLVCRSERERLFARQFLEPDGRLRKFRLLELIDEPQDRSPSLLRQSLKPSEAVVRYLLGQPPPPRAGWALTRPAAGGEPFELNAEAVAQLARVAADLSAAAGGVIVRLLGEDAAALAAAARELARRSGRALLAADANHLADEAACAAFARDALLHGAVAAVTVGEHDPAPAALAGLARLLVDAAEPLLILGSEEARLPPLPDATLLQVSVDPPGFAIRRAAWAEVLAEPQATSVDRLADAFRFGGRQVRQTATLARQLARLRDDTTPAEGDYLEAGRQLTAPSLGRFATRVRPVATWADLVLPAEKARQLRTVADRVRHRRTVHSDWGFGGRTLRGNGLSVLFSGPSGTGKTLAAEVLAAELNLVLYVIDLASVVSKYIGETEKHLGTIFREAGAGPCVLFFDEADSLFGKRTEVQDAHDRYANIEVNYLLQRLERYDGIVILASNFQRNIDDAFVRRLQDIVEFPYPDAKLREQIWRGHVPAAAPVSGDADFAFLAARFKFSGAQIKNAVLHAAYLAARDRQAIGMGHLVRAVRAEYQKEGRLTVRGDFGPYFELAHTP